MQKIALLCGSILVTLLVAEVALRIVGISYPYFTQVDAETGFSLRPNASGWVRDEGNAYVKVNSHGFRDKERSLTKPPGVVRIAVLGDSFIEARQVALEEALPAVLERKLQRCDCHPALGPEGSGPEREPCQPRPTSRTGRRVEVLNFGISGFSTIQELQILPRVLAFDPDLVIVAFTPGNDVRGNSKALSQGTQQPYFVKEEDGSYTLDTSFRDTEFYERQTSLPSRTILMIINRSRVAQLLNQGRKGVRTWGQDLLGGVRDGEVLTPYVEGPDPFGGAESGLDDEIYRESSDVRWQEAWRMTEEAFERIRDTVEANGAELVITVTSTAIQVDPDVEKRAKTASDFGVQDLLSPVRRIERIGQKLSIPVFSLVEPLGRYAEEHTVFLHGFGEGLGSGHWNAEGHRVSAEALAPFICQFAAA